MEEKARHVCKYGHRMRKEDREDAKLVVKRVKDAARSVFHRPSEFLQGRTDDHA